MALQSNLTAQLVENPGAFTSLLDGTVTSFTTVTPSGSTLFGAWVKPHAGESVPQGFTRFETNIGGTCQVKRLYDDGNGPAALMTVMNANGKGVVPLCGSFTYLNPTALAAVAAGSHDTDLDTFFAACPTNVNTYWTMNHEFDAKIAKGVYTYAQWKPAFLRCCARAALAGNAKLIALPIYTGFDFTNRFNAYQPGIAGAYGSNRVGVDPYAGNGGNHTQTVQSRMEPIYNLLQTNNLVMCVCEAGTNERPVLTNAQMADFITSVSWLNGRAEIVTMFNSPIGSDYEFDDISVAATAYGTIVNG